jgi:hypothetical protein
MRDPFIQQKAREGYESALRGEPLPYAPHDELFPRAQAFAEGWRQGRREYTKRLPPSADMELTAGSEFV